MDPLTLVLKVLQLGKTWRALLLSGRSSKFIWKAARNNVQAQGLPECPPDLSEPRYALLAFFKRCEVSPHVSTAMQSH